MCIYIYIYIYLIYIYIYIYVSNYWYLQLKQFLLLDLLIGDVKWLMVHSSSKMFLRNSL